MERTGILEVNLYGGWGWGFNGFIVTTIDQIAAKTEEYLMLKDAEHYELPLESVKFTPFVVNTVSCLVIAQGSQEVNPDTIGIGFLGRAKMTIGPCLDPPGFPVEIRGFARPCYSPDFQPFLADDTWTILDCIPADRLTDWFEISHSGN